VRSWAGGKHQCRGESFAQRRKTGLWPVSALVQCDTRGVYHKRRDIFEYKELYLVFSSALLEPLYAVLRRQPIHYGFLDYLLTVGNRGESALDRVSLNRETVVPAYKSFPGQRLRAFEKLVKCLRGKSAETYHHALGRPKIHIRPRYVKLVS
jgi:hypothetical protein